MKRTRIPDDEEAANEMLLEGGAQRQMTPEEIVIALEPLDRARRSLRAASRRFLDNLSPREREVLEKFRERPGEKP